MSKRQPSGRVSRVVSRGNGLPLVSNLIRPYQEDAWDEDGYQSFDATHYALKSVNQSIERRLLKLQANTTRLKRELWLLQRHIKEFRHPLFEVWEADMLTRLIEVAYAHQHRKLPGGVVLGQSSFAERENLTHAFSIAAKGIRQATLSKLGLGEKYHQALQRYTEVAPYRSANTFQTEFAFAKWLVEEQEDRPELYAFWSKLFPVCYDRTAQESASIF
ncbi:hypothetical protein PENANT_c029G06798 [Penicillium antarcticum]|uniref:Uncharacterized protein n=1 Tax=Penicillium antarcticum TaxID=416450 RepID=A0A1V6PVZ0_9EURO|nr:uncharacterized protein N7508_001607 [Penicillium antarcticum]KAJ5317099.1 hypothetical protein N7508_001607 [Penicillium antarcticum]OQD81125.1 hypothetical protein PENANT_c029G06798 [Penicillium antarcticum]